MFVDENEVVVGDEVATETVVAETPEEGTDEAEVETEAV